MASVCTIKIIIIIYLRASPDTCHRRMLMRKRPEEQSVTIDYLRDLHEKHEQWLFPSSRKVGGNFSLSQPSQLIEPIPETLRDRVFYLEGDHVHSSLQKVGILIHVVRLFFPFSTFSHVLRIWAWMTGACIDSRLRYKYWFCKRCRCESCVSAVIFVGSYSSMERQNI